MRRFLSLFTMLMLCGVLAFAQNRTVTGKVSDENGNPIALANVTETGTRNGVATDQNGNYTIKMRGTGGVTITYSGYNSIVSQGGAITLVRNNQALQEVVVTALGIQRQRKDLGYATAQVKTAELNQASPVNIATGLQGKISGLNVTSINSGVFEDVKINLRGIRSLTGSNNPMLLLDGVQTPLSYLATLNPTDIADVTVLKGASGAAIYGPDARNGVIVVTTKKGGTRTNPTVTFSQTQQYSTISFFPQFQNEFGRGDYGVYVPFENWSWGPAYDGSQKPLGSPLKDGTQQYVTYSPTNERKNFFNTGVTSQSDVSFGVKDFYMSVQDVRIKGIVPDDKNRRTGIRVNTGHEYGKFKVGFGVNYIQQNYNIFDDDQMAAYNTANNVGLNGGLLNLIFNTAADVPLSSYKDLVNNPFATYNTYYNHYGINPYTAIDNWRQQGQTDNLISNVDLTFKASPSFSLTWRLAGSFANSNVLSTSKGQKKNLFNVNTNEDIAGTANTGFSRNSRLSSEIFGNWNKTAGNFKFNVIAGQYVRETNTRSASVGSTNLVVPELFNVSNGISSPIGGNAVSTSRLLSVYGSLGIGYKGFLNLEVTGRNDWTSVLGLNQNNFFYPGANLSFVFTDAFPTIKSNFLSYLKVRGSINKTANAEISPYSLADVYSSTAGGFPYNVPGISANVAPNAKVHTDPNLRPEFINSKEVGLEATFFNNKIGVEVAAYTQNNTDQIIPVAVSTSTGYTSYRVNAASFVNKGIEMDLKLNPLFNFGNLKVNFKANATYGTSEIKSIFPGLDRLFIGGFTTAANYAIVGQPAFVFLASDYNRDSLGRVEVSSTTGYPSANPNNQMFGRSMPTWIVGLSPSISYKGLTLSIVGEYKGGHYAYASIGSDMAWTGVSKATAYNHRERFIMPNSSIKDASGKWVANNSVTIQDANDFFTGVYRDVDANFIIKADSWRIREVSLGYDFPASIFANQKLIKAANLTLNARNLFLWVPKSNQFTDPDFNFTSGNASGVSTSQINPPTRVIGVNLTVTF